MTDLKLVDFGGDLIKFLAAVKEAHKASSSIVAADGVLDLANANDLATFTALANNQAVKGFAFSNALGNTSASNTVVNIVSMHETDSDAVITLRAGTAKEFKYQRRVAWAKHPQLGCDTLLHLNVPVQADGTPQYEVNVGSSVTAPIHIIQKGVKLVRITNANEVKWIEFTQDTLFLGKGTLSAAQATVADSTSQATTFATVGKPAYAKALTIDIEL